MWSHTKSGAVAGFELEMSNMQWVGSFELIVMVCRAPLKLDYAQSLVNTAIASFVLMPGCVCKNKCGGGGWKGRVVVSDVTVCLTNSD